MKRFVFILAALVISSANAFAAPPMKGPALPPQPKVRPAGLPKDVVMVSPCVATMGEHWVNLKNMPTGPIYGTYQGKPVFTEIMVTVEQLKKGFSWANIRALPGYTIDHVDFAYEPNGHAGLPVPHYDVHAYYVSPAAEAKICPDGIPDPAMKPTNVTK
jgi:hypothetical protein